MTVGNIKDFSSSDISKRLNALFKLINISRFAEEHGLARKTLYKMRDSGVMPRGLLLDMCVEASINPVMVEFSPNERIEYAEHLFSYFRKHTVDELYNVSDEQNNFMLLELIHRFYSEGDLDFSAYIKEVKIVLSNLSK